MCIRDRLCTVLFFLFVLAIGIFIFFWKRKRLYQQVDRILLNYINGDYSCHLPQKYEGAIYQVFSLSSVSYTHLIHAHTYGLYPEEIDGWKRDYEKLWSEVSKVLRELSELVEIGRAHV